MTVKYVKASTSAPAKSAPKRRQGQVRPSLSFIHWTQPNRKAKQRALIRAKQYHSTSFSQFSDNKKNKKSILSHNSLPYKDIIFNYKVSAMAHGGYGKRRVAERKPVGRRSKGLAVEKKPKPKSVSLKNQIRSVERMLRKVWITLLPLRFSFHFVKLINFEVITTRTTLFYLLKELRAEVREAQQKKLEELKKQQEIHTRLAVERKIFLRDRKIKFFGMCCCFHYFFWM